MSSTKQLRRVGVIALLAALPLVQGTTVHFQQGVDGYSGTQDTVIRFATPDRVDGNLNNLAIDGSDGGGANHGLIRFDNIFGSGPGQIPPGSVIISARLTLTVFDAGAAANIHRVLQPWDEATATWNIFNPNGEGIVADDVIAAVEPEVPQFTNPTGTKVLELNPATIQAWLDGTAPNHGWGFIPTGTDGWDVRSSEYATVAERPKLTVVFGLANQPVLKNFIPLPTGFTALISDSTPPNGLLNPASLKVTFDGAEITPAMLPKAGADTAFSYIAPEPLPANSSHTVVIRFADSSTPPKEQVETNVFVTAPYTLIPPELAVSSVDSSKPGFKIRVVQLPIARFPGNRGLMANAERALDFGYNDPATGQPFADEADPAGMPDNGFFTEPGVINLNEGAPAAAGNFSIDSTPPAEDKPFPGIPGLGVSQLEQYVTEVQTYLELKKGTHRFGVSSDDGFKVLAGVDAASSVGLILGTLDGTRGTADSIFDFVVQQDGFYPIRLVHTEATGGSTLEFFAVDILTDEKTLINSATGATPIRAFRESAAARPHVSRAVPPQNYAFTFADENLVVDITDGASAVDTNSIVLSLNGTAQQVGIQKSGNVTTVTRAGGISNLLPSGANDVSLVYSFTEQGATKTVTNEWSFSVPRYAVIPPGNKVPATTVSGSGFKATLHQIDRSGDANQGNGGRYSGQGGGGNNMPRPEIQLSNSYINRADDTPYPNLAGPGTNPDGSSDMETLNHNLATGANIGVFQGSTDLPIPGLPGTGSSQTGLDNFVQEVFTYLELKAGAQVFAINNDDGFTISSSPNPRDTLGTLIAWRNPGGGQAAPLNPANSAFNLVVLEDGIYPIRILWWQGGGGANIEFMSIDRNTGMEVLVNDLGLLAVPANAPIDPLQLTAVKAYNTYTGPVRPWVKFSVYPMPSLWHNQHQQSGPGPIEVRVGAGNPADIANDSPNIRPFGDSVGAIIADLGSGSVDLVIDGQDVTPTVTDIPGSGDKLVAFTPNPPFESGSTHTAGLVYGGTTNYWTFTVISNVTLQSGLAVPSSRVDPAARGFRAKVVQATAARSGANSGNNVASAEDQLAGNPPSVAIAGPDAGGSYILTNIINWSSRRVDGQSGNEIGNFIDLTGSPDDPIPGLPGTGLTGTAAKDNVAAEIFAYLDLPAGYQKFGVNGDDGWKVQVGTPGQTTGPVLFSVDRAAGARDIPFAFITLEAGLYPVRLVWYQGGGDGNLEFFSYGPGNEKIPVNADDPNAIKAYYNVTGGGGGEQPVITVTRAANGDISITWSNGGTLQSSTALSATPTWTDVDSDGSYSTTPSGQSLFYRVRK